MNQELQENLEKLYVILDDLVRVYRSLLDTVRREKEILISSHLDDLNENNRAKEAMLAKVSNLEEQRILQVQFLSKFLSLKEESPRLLEIARVVGGSGGDHLRNIHSVLEILLKRVQELNKENKVLVESALQTVTGAMKSIRENLQDKQNYQRKGEVKAGVTSTGHLVKREV
ncbi:MAG: flagellar protein FlgN [Bdellovibrionales bacterium]|nr:flagellar protein FlgN [Bdellovibrionales bacterium]